MQRGGKRQGAGRKVAGHTLEAAKYREILIAKVVAYAEPLAQALVDRGLAGDVPALKEINERALGKVKDSLDLTSKGKQITSINYVVPNGDNSSANPEAAPSQSSAQ